MVPVESLVAFVACGTAYRDGVFMARSVVNHVHALLEPQVIGIESIQLAAPMCARHSTWEAHTLTLVMCMYVCLCRRVKQTQTNGSRQ
jgi:hypothetical protein